MNVERIKYPRTFHVPFSPGATSDDKVLSSLSHFEGRDIVITEKRDGENTTIYSDGYLHARSIDGRSHPSRDWVKANIVPKIAYQVPTNVRFCGENTYAKHSIAYDDLPSYFEVFSCWEGDKCINWLDTNIWCCILGLYPVPELYRGTFSEKLVKELANDLDLTKVEGFVIRVIDDFHFSEFSSSVAKFVRPNHVQSEDHWMHQQIIPNKLK